MHCPGQPRINKRLPDKKSGRHRLPERSPLRRIDIQDHLRGPVLLARQDQRRVVLHRPLVGEPQQGAPVVAQRVPHLAVRRLRPQRYEADPRRRGLRQVLLHKRPLTGPDPDDRQRPVPQFRQDEPRDGLQVLHQVPLGRARLVEQRLVQVSQRDVFGHGATVRPTRKGAGAMAFSGWPEEALDFYDGLAADNTKTYWTGHKAVYDEKVLGPMTELTEELAAEFGEPKLFRPYRDVRFSADKTPYKTHIGTVLGGTGYVQLSAEGLAAGAGMWQMSPEQLARYRAAVASDRLRPAPQGSVATIEKARHPGAGAGRGRRHVAEEPGAARPLPGRGGQRPARARARGDRRHHREGRPPGARARRAQVRAPRLPGRPPPHRPAPQQGPDGVAAMAGRTLAGNGGGQGPADFFFPNGRAYHILAHRERRPVRTPPAAFAFPRPRRILTARQANSARGMW